MVCKILFSIQAELDGALQIGQVAFVVAHRFFRGIGELCHRAAIDVLQLDDDIQRMLAGIVGAEGADAKGYLRPVPEVFIELLRSVKIQAVAEQQLLAARVNAIFFIVRNDLFTPGVGISAVVPDAGIVVDHGPVKVVEEQVRGDGVGQGGAVVTENVGVSGYFSLLFAWMTRAMTVAMTMQN